MRQRLMPSGAATTLGGAATDFIASEAAARFAPAAATSADGAANVCSRRRGAVVSADAAGGLDAGASTDEGAALGADATGGDASGGFGVGVVAAPVWDCACCRASRVDSAPRESKQSAPRGARLNPAAAWARRRASGFGVASRSSSGGAGRPRSAIRAPRGADAEVVAAVGAARGDAAAEGRRVLDTFTHSASAAAAAAIGASQANAGVRHHREPLPAARSSPSPRAAPDTAHTRRRAIRPLRARAPSTCRRPTPPACWRRCSRATAPARAAAQRLAQQPCSARHS